LKITLTLNATDTDAMIPNTFRPTSDLTAASSYSSLGEHHQSNYGGGAANDLFHMFHHETP